MPDQKFCASCGKATSGEPAGLGPMPYFTLDAPEVEKPPFAGYWWRVLGYVIDGIILSVVVTFPLRAMHSNAYATSIIAVAITFMYGTFLLARWNGQTLGMRVVRIRCVEAVSHAQLTLSQAARRTAIYCAFDLLGTIYHYTTYLHPTSQQKIENGHHAIIALLLLLPLFVDLLWPLWDKRNQTLHDKMANTVALRPRDGSATVG
jgi:uncharacterized RDD family membrane protein YckC